MASRSRKHKNLDFKAQTLFLSKTDDSIVLLVQKMTKIVLQLGWKIIGVLVSMKFGAALEYNFKV